MNASATAEPNVMRAFMAFREVLETGMNPELLSTVQQGNDWRKGEYDLVIRGSSMYGVIHEEISSLLQIAEKHGGRLWLDRQGSTLAILFPYERPAGPGEDESPSEETRRKSRGGKRVEVKQ